MNTRKFAYSLAIVLFSDDDVKVEEYKSLRASIDMHIKLIPVILAFIVAATSALLGYGFKTREALVFLTPLLVIYPCAYLIKEQMEEVLRKGAYIMKRYEPETEVKEEQMWETRFYNIRKEKEVDKNILFTKAAGDSRAIVILTNCLVLLCFICFSFSSHLKMIYVLSGVFLIAITYFLPPLRSILTAYTYEKQEEFLDCFSNQGKR